MRLCKLVYTVANRSLLLFLQNDCTPNISPLSSATSKLLSSLPVLSLNDFFYALPSIYSSTYLIFDEHCIKLLYFMAWL